MKNAGFTENDWKLFKSKIGGWQEAYMDRLNREYIELLNKNSEPSEIFWELEGRIKKDKKKTGVCLEMSRSCFIQNIYSLINDGVISTDELKLFSTEFKATIQLLMMHN